MDLWWKSQENSSCYFGRVAELSRVQRRCSLMNVSRPLSPEGADLKLLMMELGKQITAGPPWSGQTGIYRGRLGEKRN